MAEKVTKTMSLLNAVEKLRTSTSKLNHYFDDINRLVNEMESFLESLNVGIETEIIVNSCYDEKHGGTDHFSLIYTRVGSRFRIAVREWFVLDHEKSELNHDPIDYSSSPKPWSDCSRQVKLNTALHITTLIIQIAEVVDNASQETQKVYKQLEKSIKPILKSGKAEEDANVPF